MDFDEDVPAPEEQQLDDLPPLISLHAITGIQLDDTADSYLDWPASVDGVVGHGFHT